MQGQINTQVLRLLDETTREVSVTAEVLSEKDCSVVFGQGTLVQS